MTTLVATFSHPFQGLAGLWHAFDGFFASLRRAQEFEALYAMSDAELAARGYSRETLIEAFFGA